MRKMIRKKLAGSIFCGTPSITKTKLSEIWKDNEAKMWFVSIIDGIQLSETHDTDEMENGGLANMKKRLLLMWVDPKGPLKDDDLTALVQQQ